MKNTNTIKFTVGSATVSVVGPGGEDVIRRLLAHSSEPAATAPVDTLLGVSEVAQELGCERQTVWAWARDGLLPTPDNISPRGRKLWRAGTIAAWKAAPPTARLLKRLKRADSSATIKGASA